MIYLDHNATTYTRSEVLNKMNELIKYGPLNPSSIHLGGQKAKSLIEDARRCIAYLLGIDSILYDPKYRIIFTSSGTEANNLIISNFKNHDIFISAVEHPSIYAHSKYLDNIQIIKVDKNGILDVNDLIIKLQQSHSNQKLVSVMFANNETGVIQPIKQICKTAHDYGALIHSDCTQAIGKIDVDIQDLEVDFLSLSGHKFGGPMGVGALIAKECIVLKPQIIGGGQEKFMRSGTENVPAIVGVGVAAKLVKDELVNRNTHMSMLQCKLEKDLLAMSKNIEIVGYGIERLPNTSLILNYDKRSNAKVQVVALDLKGIAVSSGAACSSGISTPSHVLPAMGYLPDKIDSALRISVGIQTTNKDIEDFIRIYSEMNE